MNKCRIEKTYRVCDGSMYNGNRMVGGLYPDVKWDDQLFQRFGQADKSVPELAGLQPEGFVDGTEFDVMKFDFDKLAEIRETVLRYFTLIEGYDCEADLDNMTALVRELHSCPESYTKGQLRPGELILAMWMAEVPFKRFKYQDLPETVVFAVDWDEVSDPANYIDNFHGFENLLRPSSGWFKPEGDRVSVGGGVDFLCLNPKVSEGALAGPFPVCSTC